MILIYFNDSGYLSVLLTIILELLRNYFKNKNATPLKNYYNDK